MNADELTALQGHPLAPFPLTVMNARRERFDVENFATEAAYDSANRLLQEDNFLSRAFRDITAYLTDEILTHAEDIHMNEELALAERRSEQ